MTWAFLIALGLLAGTFSGMVGIGGGIILIPALVYGFGLSQHQAQGTTLAIMVPPISALAAWAYYQKGHVDLKMAAGVAAGFTIGAFLGARYATQMPELFLKRLFATVMVVMGLRMWWSTLGR
jgi:uncharacterized protein